MLVTFNKQLNPFDQAVQLHQSGKFPEAEAAYKQILAQQPNNADALHMLGLLYFQAGQPAPGVELITRALQLTPQNAAAYSNLGEIKRSLGQLDEAADLCRRALALNPALAAANANLAMILYQQRRFDEALPLALQSVKQAPMDAGGYGVTGLIMLEQNRLQEAVQYLNEAARRAPNDPTRVSALGFCLERLEQFEQALSCYQRAVQLAPNHSRLLLNLGALFARMERYADSEEWILKALQAEPGLMMATEQLAAVKMSLRKFEESIELCRKSIAANPAGSDAYATLGEALMGLGRFDECIEEMKKATAIKPTFAIYQTHSNALVRDLRGEEGLATLEKALAIDPQNPILHFNKSIILLLLGRLEEAWPEYEWRWQHPRMGWRNRQLGKPKWDGSPLNGKRILLHAEQGMGDTIFFGRFITHVAERGGFPVVFAQTSMVELVKTIKGVGEVIGEGVSLPQFDCHMPLMSLPSVFGITVDNIPNKVPYISANPDKSAYWKGEMDRHAKGKLKVGLVWEGGPFQPENFLRSASLAAYAPLADVPGVAFFGLQKGAAEGQAKNPPAGMDFTDLAPFINDFSDTAAMLDSLDLLISIDTSVIHVAAALGKPIWMMLAYSPGHMWMYGRNDTPWYPNVRIWRQPKFKDWATPVAAIKEELLKFAAR
jgi:tetratricopeptide (TPR) repeat protein